MRKILAVILLTVALALCIHMKANAQAKMTDFSGTWMLEKKKTSDLPPTLESYSLTVTQNEQQLTVETDMQGEIGMSGGSGRPGGSQSGRGGFPGGSPGGPPSGGAPGGGLPGGGFPGGSPDGGFSMPKDVVMGMALRMTVPKATYRLDGKEIVVVTEGREASSGQPAQSGGSLTFKANWKKDGKVLELQAARKIKTPSGERSLTSKDQWELSGDGKILTVKRSIETPMGTEQVKLVFIKQ